MIREEKNYLSYIIHHEDIKEYKDKGRIFEDKDVADIYDAIICTDSTDQQVLISYLEKKESKLNQEDLSFLSQNGQSDGWVQTIFNPWKKKLLIKEKYKKHTILLREGKIDELGLEMGISLDIPETELDVYKDLKSTPTIDDKVFELLPQLLKDTCVFNDCKRERDLVFLSSLSCLSILFPNVRCHWGRKPDRPNLLVSISAPPSSKKGSMTFGRDLLKRYEEEEMKRNNEERERINQENSLLSKGSEKEIFKPKVTLIPGDSSSAAMYLKLNQNDGRGLIFVTEADQIIGNKKNDWGDYDTLLRMAFHNELSSRNRKDEEIIHIQHPFISASISGTMNQLIDMFKDKSENGLFSRFIFYSFGNDVEWEDRKYDDINYDLLFNNLSDRVYEVYEQFKDYDIKVSISMELSNYMDNVFKKLLKNYMSYYGDNFSSVVYRMAVICRKVLMVMTMFRYDFKQPNDNSALNFLLEENEPSDMGITHPNIIINGRNMTIKVHEIDVYNSVSLCKTLIQHSGLVYNSNLIHSKSSEPTVIKDNGIKKMLNDLTEVFNVKDMLSLKTKYDISESTVKRFLSDGVRNKTLEKIKHGTYKKLK